MTRCHSTCRRCGFLHQSRRREIDAFRMHSTMKRERAPGKYISRVVSPRSRARITIGVTSGKPRGKTVKVATHWERAFPPSPRNLISPNVIPETRHGGGAAICIRALESLDSDFQLAARRRRRWRRGRWGVEGSEERAKRGWMRCPFPEEGEREKESAPRRSIEPLDRAGYNIFFI